jgi:DNA-binding SARP family transcriptional activator/Tfp pilus assembly protein PilF
VAAETEFCLLGPLLVRRGGIVVPVSPGKQRALLAALLLSAGLIVPVDELVEALWGSGPPPSARASLTTYVMRLRKSLADTDHSRISTQPDGYLISVGTGELDVDRFESSLAAAREAMDAGSWADAAALLRTASSLWRGQPLSGVRSDTLVLREVPRLAEMRLRALEARIDADLHLGRHADVIAELRQLAAAHPLREHLHGLLMLALYRDGRQAEALAAYQHARRVLIDEVGTEPGSELRELHQQILDADPALEAPEPRLLTASGPESVVPRELPGPVRHFVGRKDDLAKLTGLLDQASDETPGAVVISAISGTGGVGKTALAVEWANQVAPRFPDGQLYVNLRGFDPSGDPVLPAEAIRGFLGALGVASPQLPTTLQAQAGLYRSLLASRRMLIVLDNARDADQVRPLLPGKSACVVVVTSRNQLAGLVAADGACPLSVDVLTHPDAVELLALRLGRERLTSEPQAASELIELCARLPLALAIVAAHAALSPALALHELTGDLRAAATRLDAMDTGEAATSLRAVFACSYQVLSHPAARMFRLLGIHPGPDITAAAAASLAGTPIGQAHTLLHELARCHLVTELPPGRFAFHDMLRVYAAERTGAEDSNAERCSAIHRMLDHYLHTAHAAALVSPHFDAVALVRPQPGVIQEDVTDNAQAMAWFEAEHRVLLAVIALAARAGFDSHACQLPQAFTGFLDRRGYWNDYASTQQTALAASLRLADVEGQARAHQGLGQASALRGSFSDARTHYGHALDLGRQRSDRQGQARAHIGLAFVFERQGRYGESLTQCMHALELYQVLGDHARQAMTVNNIGWCHVQMGNYQQALTWCHQAIALHQELGDAHGQAASSSWDSLGYANYQLGDYVQAANCLQEAVRLFGEFGDRYGQAEALTHLGDARFAAGHLKAAREAWQQALAILDDLRHADAEPVRTKLQQLDAGEAPRTRG